MAYETYCLYYDIKNPNGAMTLMYRGRIITREASTKLYNTGGARYFSTLSGACAAIDRSAK